MDTETANQGVNAYEDRLREFCQLVAEYDDSWGDEETPTFTVTITGAGSIPIPYKKNAQTGEECRNTKLYRTRQENLSVYYALRKKFKNALWFLAMSDRDLREFADE